MVQTAAAASPSTSLDGAIVPGTLREELERRRHAKERYQPRELVSLLVPLCTELANLHAQGKALFVYPSAIVLEDGRWWLDEAAALVPPTHARDKACLAPELRNKTEGGGPRGSVFALGAILYESLTGAVVGPGMRRPSEHVPSLPAALEAIIGKALVGDRAHRPGDLGALAQALHHVAPKASIPPPPADESLMDSDGEFDVDVSLSLMPPAPSDPMRVVVVPEAPPSSFGGMPDTEDSLAQRTLQRLNALKAGLESDPRPRYVVIKDGIDHGPFSAVELLQQIATGSFLGEYPLRDNLTSEERPIEQWEQFAPFAEQAKLGLDAEKERKALDRVVAKEQRSAGYKAFIAGGVLVLALAAVAGWWYRARLAKDDSVRVATDDAMSVDVDGGLGSGNKGGPGGRWAGGGSGGPLPVLPGGMSCEAARDRYVEEYNLGGGKGPPDLTAGAYAAVLNKGSYLLSCGVPMNMSVNICAAVQNGRAVGVTVRTTPPNAGIASCVAGQVRAISFPSHPRLDIAYTTFAAQ